MFYLLFYCKRFSFSFRLHVSGFYLVGKCTCCGGYFNLHTHRATYNCSHLGKQTNIQLVSHIFTKKSTQTICNSLCVIQFYFHATTNIYTHLDILIFTFKKQKTIWVYALMNLLFNLTICSLKPFFLFLALSKPSNKI